jgi:hypothetical protein
VTSGSNGSQFLSHDHPAAHGSKASRRVTDGNVASKASELPRDARGKPLDDAVTERVEFTADPD